MLKIGKKTIHFLIKKNFLKLTKEQLTEKVASPTAQLFWFSRVEKIADWFVSEEATGGICKPIALEKKGQIIIPDLAFKLTAQVDRVDINQDGKAIIYDIKQVQYQIKMFNCILISSFFYLL